VSKAKSRPIKAQSRPNQGQTKEKSKKQKCSNSRQIGMGNEILSSAGRTARAGHELSWPILRYDRDQFLYQNFSCLPIFP